MAETAKQGQRSQSEGLLPRSTMRVPQPDIIEHFGNADAVPQPPERCLSRQAGIVRYYLNIRFIIDSSPRTDVRTKSSVRGLLLYDFIMASGYLSLLSLWNAT